MSLPSEQTAERTVKLALGAVRLHRADLGLALCHRRGGLRLGLVEESHVTTLRTDCRADGKARPRSGSIASRRPWPGLVPSPRWLAPWPCRGIPCHYPPNRLPSGLLAFSSWPACECLVMAWASESMVIDWSIALPSPSSVARLKPLPPSNPVTIVCAFSAPTRSTP